MKNHLLLILFILLFLAGTFCSVQRRTVGPHLPAAGTDMARKFFPEAQSFTEKKQPFPFITALDGQKVLATRF